MRYNILIALAALAAVLLPGCSRVQEEAPAGVEKQPLRFTASVGSYATKATDTAFEEGDAVSLYTDGNYEYRNVRMVYSNGEFTPEEQIDWSPWQYVEEPMRFWAFYPYLEKADMLERDWVRFTVRSNQSTHQGFTQSDFMSAYTQSAPADGPVHLHFVHRMSKLLVYVDNMLDGVSVVDVYLGGIWPEVYIYKDGTTSYSGNTPFNSIKMGQVTDREGRTAWAAIIPPQGALPVITLVGSDGKYYSFATQSGVSFEAGCSHKAYVSLTEDTVSADFSSDVEWWVDNGDVNFQDPADKIWSITGTVQGLGWSEDIVMERVGDYFWAPVYCKEGDEFKFRADFNWDYNFGSGAYDGGYGWYRLVGGGPNISIENEDVYSVYLYPRNEVMEIVSAVDAPELSLVGTILGSEWDTDFPMQVYVSRDNAGTGYPVYCYLGLEYRAGQEFKIRFKGEWNLDYGAETIDPVWESCRMVRGWYNVSLAQDGVYNILFDWYHKRLQVDRTGDLPSSGTTVADVLNGEDGEVYTVTGRVAGILNVNYGNYYIADDTGYVYIYGTKNADGQYPKDAGSWYFWDYDLVNGDIVTVTGPRSTYNGTVELVDVQVVEVLERTPLGIIIYNDQVGASGGTIELWVRAVSQIDAGVDDPDWAGIASVDYIGNNWYHVMVSVSANTSADNRRQLVWINTSAVDGSTYGTQTYINQSGAPVPSHAGSSTDPYSVADARLVASTLSWTSSSVYESTDPVYIKGIVSYVSQEFSTTYNNATIFISDTGERADEFQLYRVRYWNNADYTDGAPQVAVGDEVMVYGPIMNYRGSTPETVANEAYLVSFN